MAYSPGVSSLKGEQFRAGDVEYLPSVVPHSGILRTICFRQMWPNFFLVGDHLGEPVLRTLVRWNGGRSKKEN